MSEATAAQPTPEPLTLEELAVRHNALMERLTVQLEVNAALARRASVAGPDPDLAIALTGGWHRVADVQGDLRENAGLIRDAITYRTVEEARQRAAEAAVAEPAPARARHRAPRTSRDKSGPGLRLASFAALGTAVRHSWAAHPVAAGAIAGTAATIAVGGVAVQHVTSHSPATSAVAGAVPGTSGIDWAATPVASPSQVVHAATHPHLDARSSRQNAVPGPGSLPSSVYLPPAGDPSPQDSAPPAQVSGTLSADVTGLNLGTAGAAYDGTVNLTASGGPVEWHAVCSDTVQLLCPGVRQGTIAPGDSYAFSVSIDPAAQFPGGTAVITFWPGDVRVNVTWAALPVQADPSPLPTDLPSVLPSAPGS